jgi:glycosyltransferase involved in cell wall biosynthesis
VISDINFHHNPQDLKWSNAKYYNTYFPKFAREACRIGTISDFSKQDIVETYKVDPEKIDTIYCGLNNFYKPVPPETRAAIKKELTGGEDYFVFVGTIQPRKNVSRLLSAFELFKKQTHSTAKLVIAGKLLFKTDELMQQHAQMLFSADVIFTGRIDDDKLKGVLGSALALTFVPYFEGFGLPILEAMQCDVPVICSNITSMPEVAGDAALLINPLDIEDIKNAMVTIHNDATLRSELIAKGKVRKDVFTWERTADLLWDGVTRCL